MCSHISSLGKPEHCFITKTTKTRSSRRSSFAIAISRECHSGASQCHEGLSYEPWEQADGRDRRKNPWRRRNPRQLTELPHAADKSPEGIFPACRPGFSATGPRGAPAQRRVPRLLTRRFNMKLRYNAVVMGGVLLSARLLLAAVFAVAGVTKLADRAGTAESIVNFGVPSLFPP